MPYDPNDISRLLNAIKIAINPKDELEQSIANVVVQEEFDYILNKRLKEQPKDLVITLTGVEYQRVLELAEKMSLSPQRVMIQALRLLDYVEVNREHNIEVLKRPVAGGCGGHD